MPTKSPKYFIWIALHVLVWLAAMSGYIDHIGQEFWRLLSLAGYFLVFFLIPLAAARLKHLSFLMSMGSIFSIITVYPLDQETFNPFILLILALLVAEMAHRLPLSYCILPAVIQVIGVGLLAYIANLTNMSSVFMMLYMLMLFSAAIVYSIKNTSDVSTKTRYDALLSEFRNLKRRVSAEEEQVRQEERRLIGHEIHDSVGHKLTALIMQLESFRLQTAPSSYQEQVLSLKNLAQESLDETRRAVRTFKQEETGGLPGIIRLIRRLESDSFLRIRFTVDHGAFSAPLDGEQSFVIYRSVQEALTNIMKHSKAREAKVAFEVPGGSVFRFEVSNPVANRTTFQEGFGLTSMRERLQKINGDLDVLTTEDQFIVRGWIRLIDRR